MWKEGTHQRGRKDWKPINNLKICVVCTIGLRLSNVNDFYCGFSCVAILKAYLPAEMWECKRADGRQKLKPNAAPSFCKFNMILLIVSLGICLHCVRFILVYSYPCL